MNDTEQIPSTVDMIDVVKKPKLSSSCHVCGTDGAQSHYGGVCCVSCKMFFRRNSQFNLVGGFGFLVKLYVFNFHFRMLINVYLMRGVTSRLTVDEHVVTVGY